MSDQPKIAVFGASGFVGVRLMEMAILGGAANAVAVLRQPRGMARLSRLGVQPVSADLSRPETLPAALSGCPAAVNLTAGETSRFLPDLQNLVAACRNSGVRTLIHLSSAIVFEQVESPPPTSEDSLPKGPYDNDYNSSKAAAEHWLAGEIRKDGLRIVCFRPGLIWGPRSPWATGPATALREGSAFLFDDGRHPCNLCHVDNVVAAIIAAATHPSPTSGFYNLADPAPVNWRTYYHALAAEIGVNPSSIPNLPSAGYRESQLSKIIRLKDIPAARALKRRLRSSTKLAMQRWLMSLRPPPLDPPPAPKVHRSMWRLQTIQNHLPTGEFQRKFSHQPPVNFQQGMESTGRWLRESGYAL